MNQETKKEIKTEVHIPEGDLPENATPVLKAQVKNEKNGKFHNVETYLSKEQIEQFKKDPVGFGQELMKGVVYGQDFNLIAFAADYKLVDYTPPENPYFNTKVQVNIPYTLHVPNGYPCKINKVNKEYEAFVRFYKIWTNKAIGSSYLDVVVNDEITQHKDHMVGGFQFPQPPEYGWQMKVEGTNIEKTKDDTGYFRYTKLILEFNTELWKSEGDEKSRQKAKAKVIDGVINKTKELVSKILDVYRFVTQEEYIERTNNINIIDILFVTTGEGFYPYKDRFGISKAIMNRRGDEIGKIREMLENNTMPELYELLLLNSKSAYNKGTYSMSVLESSQALEVFLENHLIEKYKNKGLSEKESFTKLEDSYNWRIKNRLKDLLFETTGARLSDDTKLWDKWTTAYDKIRHPLIHEGYNVSASEAKNTILVNEEVIKWIKALK